MHHFNLNFRVTDHRYLTSIDEWGEFGLWHRCQGWGLLEEPVKTPRREIILRENVSIPQAREEIIDFLKQNPGEIFVSEIIQELRLDLDIILEILEQLYDEGYIDRVD